MHAQATAMHAGLRKQAEDYQLLTEQMSKKPKDPPPEGQGEARESTANTPATPIAEAMEVDISDEDFMAALEVSGAFAPQSPNDEVEGDEAMQPEAKRARMAMLAKQKEIVLGAMPAIRTVLARKIKVNARG